MSLSTFVPIYKPTQRQAPLLAQQRKLQARKRKRHRDSQEDGLTAADDLDAHEAEPVPTTTFHPINRTDPYHIAGHPREKALPPFPFPYAAVESAKKSSVTLEDEEDQQSHLDDKSSSLKRRHVDNVTAILHHCMLKGDWQRASRAWGLLLRTEIRGFALDPRQHGRWAMAAEILMRRQSTERSASSAEELDLTDPHRVPDQANDSGPSNEGFQLAREYYERLVLQYPPIARARNLVNSLVFYPALFNIWIFEVQGRSRRAREAATSDHASLSEDDDRDSEQSPHPDIRAIREQELLEALPMVRRLDELLLSPPYDSSPALLQLRAMTALWVADLHINTAPRDTRHATESRQRSKQERLKAKELLQKLGEQPDSREDLSSIDDPSNYDDNNVDS